MHIPDGMLAPHTYLPAYAVAAATWGWATRGLRERLDETMIPRLAMTTALAYALGLVMLPLPGGTSGHALGAGLLGLLFGVRIAFVAYSLVLLLQALLFGAGGVTALAFNALMLGLAGAATAVTARHLLSPLGETISVMFAVWLAVMASAFAVALVLGIQPWIARQPDGTPSYFPFGPEITLPAVMIPHALIGAAEAALSLLVWRFAKARRWMRA